MRAGLVEHLRAPIGDGKLELDALETAGDDVLAGRLVDPATGFWYRIEEGIADLLPPAYRNRERHALFCRKHGLAHVPAPNGAPGPDANAVNQIRFFSERSEAYESEVVDSPFYQALERVTVDRWIARTLAPGMLVVEVGCGSGRQTLPILAAGGDVVGVDLSEDMLRLARRKALAAGFATHADFVVGIAESLPLAAQLADAAIILGGLHHFSDPPAAVREVSRLMKSGGRLYVAEPHKSPVRFVFDWMMRRWSLWQEQANDDPLFTAAQFHAWLEAGRFEARIRYSTYLPPHLFYLIGRRHGERLLAASDAVCDAVPGLRKLGGVIVAEAVRR